MQTTVIITLSKDEHAHLRAMAARLDMDTELAGKFLLKAAVEALEPEEEFKWPLFLMQANSETVKMKGILLASALLTKTLRPVQP